MSGLHQCINASLLLLLVCSLLLTSHMKIIRAYSKVCEWAKTSAEDKILPSKQSKSRNYLVSNADRRDMVPNALGTRSNIVKLIISLKFSAEFPRPIENNETNVYRILRQPNINRDRRCNGISYRRIIR